MVVPLNFSIDDVPRGTSELEALIDSIEGLETVKNNKKKEIYNVACSFDIETSSFYTKDGDKRAIMYGWTFGMNGWCILGRTWAEFEDLLNRVAKKLKLNENRILIVYVHNLSFEFQFLRKRFEWSKVFALKERTPVSAITTTGIEFRCSYILSGYGLLNLGKNLIKYPVQKMDGDLDYKLIRHSQTELTEKEKRYMTHDILVVMAYIQERIEIDGDITKIPLTKTGYVRNHCRNACQYNGSRKTKESVNKYYRYRDLMNLLKIDSDEYMQLKRGFQGGFTHASCWKSGKVLEAVGSFDFKSSYPAVMVAEKYPMSRAEKVENISLDEFEKSCKLYCCLFDVEFVNIRETLLHEHPISISRCRGKVKWVEDNGRLVEAAHIITTMTEQDYMTAKEFYTWDEMIIHNFRRYMKDYLPKDFVLSILEMYKDKTELDGVDPVNYARSKTMINAAFGMIVTDICRDDIIYNGEWSTDIVNVEEAITSYNKSRSRFLFYPWGVWVTAYARRNLFTGIREFGPDYVYSDTDSIKAINYRRHMAYIEAYNKWVVAKLDRACEHHGINPDMTRPKTKAGKVKQLGIWDFELEYGKFKTLGAKRYMVFANNTLSLTISGVNKKTAVPYLLEKYDGDIDAIFEAFSPGLDIPPGYAGKNTHTYIDYRIQGYVEDYLGVSGKYDEYSSVHLEEAGYSLSLSKEYADFLAGLTEVYY